MTDMHDKIRIYSSDEEAIKLLGEVLGSASGRSILALLSGAEMTAGEISNGTGLSLSLTLYRLEKMQAAGIARVGRLSTNRRGHEMKHYSARSAILILPEDASRRARASKSLSLSLERITRFSAIGAAGLSSWLVARSVHPSGDVWQSAESSAAQSDPLVPVIVGLVTERVLSHRYPIRLS